jgi:CRISPR-associated endonuclease/helicase Cas3
MSATLPKIDKITLPFTQRPDFVELLPEPKHFFTNPNFAERVSFSFELIHAYKPQITLDQLASEVIKKSEEYIATVGADLCVSPNKEPVRPKTVHTIIEFIFKKSASEFKDVMDKLEHPFEYIFVLSGTILESRRREIINFLKNKANRSKNVLLITTQVVEAGVDIDMDLGFKNKSLIDSDEQLAGRVNRNVNKERCMVYLFQKDDASMLYKSDYRYTAMRDKISQQDHADILLHKDFDKLYNQVLNKIDNLNANENFVNFNNDYLPFVQNMDYKNVNEKFKLIDSNNVSIFVPLDLPIKMQSDTHTLEKPDYENTFSISELDFLRKSKCSYKEDKTIRGKDVWLLYRDLLENRRPDFTEQIVSIKTIQGILSKFSFSIFYTEKLKNSMMQFRDTDIDFERYWYLRDYDSSGIYDLEYGLKNANQSRITTKSSAIYAFDNGLMTEKIEDSDHSIL